MPDFIFPTGKTVADSRANCICRTQVYPVRRLVFFIIKKFSTVLPTGKTVADSRKNCICRTQIYPVCHGLYKTLN